MKALVLKEYMKLNYEETPTPELGAGEVLVAVKACGICGSDVHGFDGSTAMSSNSKPGNTAMVSGPDRRTPHTHYWA